MRTVAACGCGMIVTRGQSVLGGLLCIKWPVVVSCKSTSDLSEGVGLPASGQLLPG